MTTRLRTVLTTAATSAVLGCSAGTATPASTTPLPGGPSAPPSSAAAPGSVLRPVFAADLDAAGRLWVDETLASLSLRERVGQLVIEWMPGGYVSPSAPDFGPLDTWVTQDRIGGVSPSIGLPHSYVAKINALQERSKVPLLVTADFENGGPGMRINGAYALPSMLAQGGGTDFPPTMAFGAIGDERFAFEYGRITAREARAVGVHFLFAPVLDVNNNPDNPVIATRSFGGDPDLVARMGAAFVRGARAGGAFTTGKHFPGHGDTDVDSHVGLPVISGDRAKLDAIELVPFVGAIEEGVDAIMTAHVTVPGLLGPGGPPATLSPEVLTGLLRDDLGFDGILFTDAMSMRAITDAYGIGEASVRALEAGADVILSPKDVPAAMGAVMTAVESGRLTEERIDRSVRRLLELKARVGLHRNRLVSLDAVDEVVGSGPHLAFADSAASRSITLVRDAGDHVPLSHEDVGRLVHLRYAGSTRLWASRAFTAGLLERVPDAVEVRLDERSDSAAYEGARAALSRADEVIVSAYVAASAGSGPEAVPESLRELVAEAASSRPTVLISFGNPYLLAAFPDVGSYLAAWGDRPRSQTAALKAVFGEEPVSGRLPIALPPYHTLGEGLDREKVSDFVPAIAVEDPLVAAGIVERGDRNATRVQVPQEVDAASVGMDAEALARVDEIIRTALADSAASGAALAIGRHGRLVRMRGFGELAWGSGRPVEPTSIWDMASVSKVVGTTTGAMILVEEGRLDLDAPVVRYLPWWSRGDPRKGDVTIRQLLIHRTGLIPFRRWYLEIEGRQAYMDAAADEPLQTDPGAQTAYSDIGIMTLAWVMEEITGTTLDAFLEDRVWGPLGMTDTQYNPPDGLKPRIAATEVDTVYRNGLVWGTVHDENADAQGGVAGHAGLFSTAVDLSVFASMMLSGGVAGPCTPGLVPGEACPVARAQEARLLDATTIETWTRPYDETSSRGIGWDTPSERSSGGDWMSPSAFGHTGYTGTSIWMDPELDLFVILLTNRVHPTRENQKHVPLRRAVADAAVQAITDQPVRRRIP